jgi:hypothetical protein
VPLIDGVEFRYISTLTSVKIPKIEGIQVPVPAIQDTGIRFRFDQGTVIMSANDDMIHLL